MIELLGRLLAVMVVSWLMMSLGFIGWAIWYVNQPW